MIKKVIIVISIPILVFVMSFNLTKYEIVNNPNSKIVEAQVSTKELQCYMHEMANSLILAEDNEIWGEKEMNSENINKVLAQARLLAKDTDNNQLLRIAERWDKYDFTSIVNDHNLIWDMLKGTTGRANEANEDAIKEAIARLNQ